jgi:NAD(P)-dependent dehydrogenase (short-subunit alcohol dehydrogenase family)
MNKNKNFLNFNEKIAFVVGGSGLIGKEISFALAAEGARVVIIDKKNVKNLRKKDNTINFEELDLTKKNAYLKYNKILKKYKCPDIFINCSYPKTNDWKKNSISEITLKSLKKNVEQHLISYTWLARQTAEKMKKLNKKSSIVLLSSIYGTLGQDLTIYEKTNIKENLSYSIIKGGIVNLSRQLASYYGKDNIRVNTICPGGIKDKQNKILIKNYNKKVPLKRMATSLEIANAVLFLASEASSYITGSTLMVDGGWSAI